MKKSYRQIRAAFAPQIFNLPLFKFFCKEVQFKLLENGEKVQEEQSPHQLVPKIQKMIINLHQLLTFLSPMLPAREEALRSIDLEDTEDEQTELEDEEEMEPGKEDKDNKEMDLDLSQDKGQVRFTTNNPSPSQTKTLRVKDAYQTPDIRNDEDEDKDKDNDGDDDADSPPQTRRAEDMSQKQQRSTKYSLRKQPQPKRRFPALDD